LDVQGTPQVTNLYLLGKEKSLAGFRPGQLFR
jgi:hypothetical protein